MNHNGTTSTTEIRQSLLFAVLCASAPLREISKKEIVSRKGAKGIE
ncbi:hypothetical protein PLANPX_5108 [Lacipirellula parvula]|uniref:Uncharacterized protein n=1 Tax=Lacipirellula parvula TaxID=2650471 RepID=A0A5K7XLH5_9BACT|nr:hypothetical protein PLANPX_5108 [Lacipirellula parvula]